MMIRRWRPWCVLLLLWPAACAVRQVQPSPAFSAGSRWVVLPFVNHSESPGAGVNAGSLSATLLRIRGLTALHEYREDPAELPALDDSSRLEAAVAWAKRSGFRYGLTGRVQEWRYRAGLDGEPAVGLVLSIVDLESGQTIWTATGARSGWGTDTVSGTAQTLIEELVAGLKVPSR